MEEAVPAEGHGVGLWHITLSLPRIPLFYSYWVVEFGEEWAHGSYIMRARGNGKEGGGREWFIAGSQG